MIGRYRFKQNGRTVAESTNVVTTFGREAILRYLAGDIDEWAGAVVVGVSDEPATMGDRRLNFEADRAPIVLRVADVQEQTIVVRATFGTGIIGKIYEVGVVTNAFPADELGSSRILTRFDSSYEELIGGQTDVNNYRLSEQTLSLVVAANGRGTIELSSFYQDFSVYQDNDTFALAYELFDANAARIVVQFLVDDANYFEYTILPIDTPGYYVVEWQRAACAAVGTPSWGEIGSMRFHVDAETTGTVVNLDGLRINDVDAEAADPLVSRSVLTEPLQKVIDEELEIEYEVEMNWID